jgi:hypothetical protein
MAYNFTAASSQYLSAASAPVTTYPLTLAAWIYPTSTASPTAIVSIENTSTGHRFILQQNAVNGSHIQATAVDAAAAAGRSVTSGLTTNAWQHAAGTFSTNNSDNWTAYLNGSSANQSASFAETRAPSTLNGTKIGARTGASLGLYFAGIIAEVGIWNVALTAAEIASLAKGVTCNKIRPQNLVFYAPLIRNLQDTKGGRIITPVNSPIVAAHPRVYA